MTATDSTEGGNAPSEEDAQKMAADMSTKMAAGVGFDYQKYMESMSTVLEQQKALVDSYAVAAKNAKDDPTTGVTPGETTLEDFTKQMSAAMAEQGAEESAEEEVKETEDASGESESNNAVDTYVIALKEGGQLSMAQQWAIACGADLSARNSSYLNAIESGLGAGVVKNLLAEWWGVNDRASAISTLTNLRDHGHRASFDAVKSSIELLLSEPSVESIRSKYEENLNKSWTETFASIEEAQKNKKEIIVSSIISITKEELESEKQKAIEDSGDEDDVDSEIDLLKKYVDNLYAHASALHGARDLKRHFILYNKMKILRDDGLLVDGKLSSIVAWDSARLINVARGCVEAKYLTEAEAWSFIMGAAKELAKTYTSWEELSVAYSTGYLFWDGGNTSDYTNMKLNRKHLLEDQKSPWVKLPWETKLD